MKIIAWNCKIVNLKNNIIFEYLLLFGYNGKYNKDWEVKTMGIKDTLNYYASFKDTDIFQPGKFNPGLFDTNKKKVKQFYPRSCSLGVMLNGPQAEQINGIIRQMNDGDLSTGVVMSTNPLLVACYSEDFDAVALYCYPTELGTKLGWSVGTRLLTVNWYNGYGLTKKNKDLDYGSRYNKKYKTVGPLIAELYTDNIERINRKKSEIPEEMWQYTEELGKQYMKNHPGVARNGCGPRFRDAIPIDKLKMKCKLDF